MLYPLTYLILYYIISHIYTFRIVLFNFISLSYLFFIFFSLFFFIFIFIIIIIIILKKKTKNKTKTPIRNKNSAINRLEAAGHQVAAPYYVLYVCMYVTYTHTCTFFPPATCHIDTHPPATGNLLPAGLGLFHCYFSQGRRPKKDPPPKSRY